MWVVKPNFWVQLTAIKCKKLTNLKPSKKREHTKMWNGSLKDERRLTSSSVSTSGKKNGKYHSSENFYDLCFYLVCRPADSSVGIKSLKKLRQNKIAISLFEMIQYYQLFANSIWRKLPHHQSWIFKVLKVRNFPTTHILREINFSLFKVSKTVSKTILQSVNFECTNFQASKTGSSLSIS